MPLRRGFGASDDLNLLRMALLEQEANQRVSGRTPSGLAHNALLSSMPLTREQGREAGVLSEMDRRFAQTREDERKRRSALEDVRASATARDFETRRGVREDRGDSGIPFTPENFRAISSRETPSVREPSPQPTRTIRRFTDQGTQPVDPDAAMGARERAELDPRVIAEQTRAAGDIAVAGMRGRGGEEESTGLGYQIERSLRNIQSIDELLPKVNLFTTGIGSKTAWIPGTPAANFRAELKTLAANIAFGELTAMREASKTGGALGQVSDEEGRLLRASLGAIEQDQSPDNMRRQLMKIRRSVERFQQAQERHGRDGVTESATAAGDQASDVQDIGGFKVRVKR